MGQGAWQPRAKSLFVGVRKQVKITYDPAKRAKTLHERGLDFEDAATVFAGLQLTRLDERADYGEDRYQTFDLLGDRLVMIVWTPRDDSRRIISMRLCHEDEEARARPYLA
jgi:uncharacterized DUF497 family protein